jgi:hypothetical protein
MSMKLWNEVERVSKIKIHWSKEKLFIT